MRQLQEWRDVREGRMMSRQAGHERTLLQSQSGPFTESIRTSLGCFLCVIPFGHHRVPELGSSDDGDSQWKASSLETAVKREPESLST